MDTASKLRASAEKAPMMSGVVDDIDRELKDLKDAHPWVDVSKPWEQYTVEQKQQMAEAYNKVKGIVDRRCLVTDLLPGTITPGRAPR